MPNQMSAKKVQWYMYVLRCSDQSLYTGITTDVQRRVKEHNTSKKGARYTRARRPCALLIQWQYDDQSQASKAEYFFKKYSKSKKENAIIHGTPPRI